MNNMENAWKLKRIAKEKGKRAIDTAWKSKPLYGQYPLQTQKVDVDLHDPYQWLRSAGIKAETEWFIVSAKDQRLFTRNFQANINPLIFIMELTLGVDPVIQAPNLLTTYSQGALFLSQISIKTGTIVLDNVY